METITQNRPIAFHAIQLAEAIVVAPLMDQFKESITKAASVPRPVNNGKKEIMSFFLTTEQVKHIAFVLSRFGFRASDGSYFFSEPSEPSLKEPSPEDVFEDMIQKELNEVQ